MKLLQVLSIIACLGASSGSAGAAPEGTGELQGPVFVPQSRALVGDGTAGRETSQVFSSANDASREEEPLAASGEPPLEKQTTAVKPRRSKSTAAVSSNESRGRRTSVRQSSGSTIKRAVAPVRRVTAPVRRVIRKVLPF